MTNKPDLESIEARVAAATPGPWEFERISHDDGDFSYERNDDHGLIAIYERNFESPMKAKFDSDFIAHAREDIPQLIKAYREQQECIRYLAEYMRGYEHNEMTENLLKKWNLE